MNGFERFVPADFAAYAAHKWRSNAFNRERLEVKQKLVSLGQDLSGQLAASDGSPLLCEVSVEHPALWNHKQVDAQHVYFSRGHDARRELERILTRARSMASLVDDPSPQRSHVHLAITLSHHRVASSLRLHADATVDRGNLGKKLAEPGRKDEFLELAHALPREFAVTLEKTSVAASEVTAAQLDDLVAALARPLLPTESRWLTVSAAIDREAAVAAEGAIVGTLRGWLVALLPLYHFIAWGRDNDYVSLHDQLRQASVAKRRRGLAKNDRVRIIAGMFSGRVGVVQSIDSKGVAKVLVGNVPLVVRSDEVEKQ